MTKQKLVMMSPHVTNLSSTKKIMTDVLIALIPGTAMGIYLFGIYSAFIILLSIASTLCGEFLFNKITKKRGSLNDMSAVVTGLILALNLPPYVPAFIPIIGGFFAIVVVKMLFGGIGRNFMNPAATGRIFLVIAFSSFMTRYYMPISYSSFSDFFYFPTFSQIMTGSAIDQVTTATPLVENVGLLQVFVGNTAGSIGETSVVAILLGFIYLSIRKVIRFEIPLIVVGVVFGLTIIVDKNLYDAVYKVLSGGLIFGAVFMVTDYSTSPNTKIGQMIFAASIGVLVFVVRNFSSYPEGMCLALIFMNLLVPMIDRFILPTRYGKDKTVIDCAVPTAIYGFLVVTLIITAILIFQI